MTSLTKNIGAFVRMMEKTGAFLIILDIETAPDLERLCLADFRSGPDEETLKSAYFPDQKEDSEAIYLSFGINLDAVRQECSRLNGTFEIEALPDGSSTVQIDYDISSGNRLGQAELTDWLTSLLLEESKAEMVINRYHLSGKYTLSRSNIKGMDKAGLEELIRNSEISVLQEMR